MEFLSWSYCTKITVIIHLYNAFLGKNSQKVVRFIFVLYILMASFLCSGDNDPSFKDAMFSTPNAVYIQRNQTHHIRCPSRRPGEKLDFSFWFKGGKRIDFTLSDRYEMSDLHGIIIHNVDLTDGGTYECRAFLTGTLKPRKGAIKVKVLGECCIF